MSNTPLFRRLRQLAGWLRGCPVVTATSIPVVAPVFCLPHVAPVVPAVTAREHREHEPHAEDPACPLAWEGRPRPAQSPVVSLPGTIRGPTVILRGTLTVSGSIGS
jgi:hypothetical protein